MRNIPKHTPLKYLRQFFPLAITKLSGAGSNSALKESPDKARPARISRERSYVSVMQRNSERLTFISEGHPLSPGQISTSDQFWKSPPRPRAWLSARVCRALCRLGKMVTEYESAARAGGARARQKLHVLRARARAGHRLDRGLARARSLSRGDK